MCILYSADTISILMVAILFLQDKLRVYLAPFLHGMRYTSFGRHFTQIEKLKEVSWRFLSAGDEKSVLKEL